MLAARQAQSRSAFDGTRPGHQPSEPRTSKNMLSNQLGLARSTAASRSERRKKESDGGILHGKATPR